MEYGIIATIITGITQVIKKQFGKDYIEILTLTLGIVSGLLFIDSNLPDQIFGGLAIGLVSMGMFDTSKLINKKSK